MSLPRVRLPTIFSLGPMTSLAQPIVKDQSSDSMGRYLLGFVCWLLGCLALPVVLLSSSDQPLPPTLTLVQLLLLLYAGTRLSLIIASRQLAPVTAMFWLFTYVAMGVAPLAQLATGIYPNVLQDYETLLPATTLILIGCVSFDVGHRIADSQGSRSGFLSTLRERTVDESRLVLLSAFSVAACGYYILSIGSPLDFFVTREHFGERISLATGAAEGSRAGSALFQAIGQVPVLVAFLCWTVRASPLRSASTTERFWWLLLASLNVVVNNPISNARFWFLTVVIAILFIRPSVAAKHFRAVLIVGVVAAVVAFPSSDVYRYDEANRPTSSSNSVVQTLASKDYDQTLMTANGIWWIDSRGDHTFGRQLVGDLLFWVPRSLWSTKPTDTGVEIGRAMQLRYTNLSSPLWIEAWVDFGWIGAVLALLALGALAVRVDTAYIAEHRRPGRSLSYLGLLLPLVAGFQLIVLRGPLLQAVGPLAAIVVVTWLVTARGSLTSPNRSA